MNLQSESSMVFILFLLLLPLLIDAKTGLIKQKPSKNETNVCDLKKVDLCAAKFFLVGYAEFPKNMDEMNKHCPKIKPLQQCIRNFAQNCLESQSKQTFSIIAYSLTKTMKGYCSNQRRKSQFLLIGKCMNEHFNETAVMWNEWIKSLVAIPTHKTEKLHLPMTCCVFYHFKQRFLDMGCSDPAETQEVENIISGLTEDTLNFICNEYNDQSDKCDGIVEKIPKWNKPLQYKSFVIPAMKILDSL